MPGQRRVGPTRPLTSTPGAIATERFAEAVQTHGLKPKQVDDSQRDRPIPPELPPDPPPQK
ncbi:hypothetical protein [Embleya sp. NPDC005971]|uniref:hypothetical protein n=1 Tax=unclassified Embleya TaxID=2699296 RepID=UPI0033DB97F6